MRKAPAKRSNLFLLVLILAIFFFALAGAVCLQLFVQARTLSQQTHARNQALVCAQNISALFEAGKGSFSEILRESCQGGQSPVFYKAGAHMYCRRPPH